MNSIVKSFGGGNPDAPVVGGASSDAVNPHHLMSILSEC